MTSVALFGSTGLVGGFMLKDLLAHDAFSSVHTISRRAPKAAGGEKLHAVVDGDVSHWPAALRAISPFPDMVFSALGTNRAAAGGVANQRKIDVDANVAVAHAAREAGAGTFVFCSSAGTHSSWAGPLPYFRMKAEVEDAVRDCGFDQAIILRPGSILGEREPGHHAGTGGNVLPFILRYLPQGAKDVLGQDAEVIARAGVHAALLAAQGKAPSKFWILEAKDIIRLGRDEWKF